MAKAPAMIYVFPSQIRERKANNRFDFGDLEGLAKSISSNGIKQPLIGRKLKDKTDDGYPIYELTDGHRRFRAAQKVAKKMTDEEAFIPLVVESADVTDIGRVYTAIVTSEHGKPRTTLEIAYDIQFLASQEIKQQEIAKTIGKSAMFVSDCLLLLEKATPDLIAQIKSGNLTPYTVIDMLKAGEQSDEIEEVAARVSKKKADKEDKVVNPDKKANTKPLKKSELEEESGRPMTVKSKKESYGGAAVSKPAAGEEVVVPKVDSGTVKIQQLLETMKANAGTRRTITFQIVGAMSKYLTGKLTALEMQSLFFWDIDEELDTSFNDAGYSREVDDSKQPAATAPTKSKKAEAKPVDDDDLDEDEEPKAKKKPAAKSAKAAPPAKSKKAAPKKKAKDEDEDDEDIEDAEVVEGGEDDDFELE